MDVARPQSVARNKKIRRILTAVLVIRFVRTGGIPMLRMMGGSPDVEDDRHEHHGGH